MPADVIIDPTNGQIYWNDGTGSPQSISIKGDAQNAISFVGYSGSYSPGSTPSGALTIATVNDNSGTAAFVPGTNAYELGSSTLRWKLFATTGNFSDSTISSSLITGSALFNGGIAVSGNASIGQSLNFYNTAATFYTGFKAGTISANTLYTLPTAFPSTGTSVLQSDASGTLTWIGVVGLATTSTNINVVSASTNASHPVLFTPSTGIASGAAVSSELTFVYNPSTDILSVSGLAVTSTTASTSSATGALQVAGGVGISGKLTFNQASFGTTGIASLPTMAMIGQTGDPIFLSILEDNSISFEGSQGQLFSISPNLTTGYIWAVNDISGVPLLRASSGGTVYISEFGGVLGIGQTNPTYKLDLKGSFGLASSNDALYNFIFSNSASSGNNTFQVRSANSIQLYNSGNTFYTAIKSNASGNVTYTLPVSDGSSGQFLQTNGTGTLSWATASGGSGSGSSGVNPGGEFEIGYYASTGSSISGSSTFKNNTSTAVVSITHSTASTNFGNGALTVSGGVGIGGSLYVGGTGSSISGLRIANGTINAGTWNGSVIGVQYGGTGQNLTGLTGILTISSGTVSASTTPNIGSATGTSLYLSATSPSNSTTTGALLVPGGVGIGLSISVGGRLQMFNGANYSAFVSAATANTVYILPETSPATGSSVLSSTSAGVMSWVPLGGSSTGLATTATNVYVNTLGNPNSFHPVLMTPAQASAGSAVSANGTVVYNPFTDILYTPGFAVTSGVDSTNTTSGALQVRGGIGVTGTGYFDVVRTRAIVTTGDVTIAGNFAVNGSTIDFGNAVTDSISFIGRVDTDIDPIADNTYDLGAPGLSFRNASFGSSIYFTNTSNTNILAFRAGATGSSLTYIFPIDTPTAGQVLAASAPASGVVTLSWEDDQTGAPAGGITQLNGLSAATQSFATGTSGTDFAISSVTSTHTFNLPDASSSARGVISTGIQTIAGAKTFSSALSITDATVATSTSTGALKVSGGAGIAGSLYTGTGFSSSVSGVVLANNTVSASTYNKVTITAPTSSATLTLSNGSSLITSGGHSLTFTTTNATNVTVPTSGTLATTSNKLSDFAATTAAELRSVISEDTGTGSLVFATSPDFTTSVTTGSATFSVFNTNATNVSAFGAATTLSLGASTGKATINSTDNSTSTTTGAFVVSGGAGIAGSLFTGTGFSSSVSGVILANNTVSASTYNKVTITAPASSATLTLSNGSSLITSGGHSLTFTTTNATNVTVPTTGTLATTSNKLSDFAATTAAELRTVVSEDTGTGSLVFATSPQFTTSVTTSDTTFSVFNANALNVNAFGAATNLSLGAASGKATINSIDNSTSTSTGALVVTGGSAIGLSLSIGGRLQLFNGLTNFTAFVSSASTPVTYTLPPTAPSGVGTSYLSASTTGVMAWVAAPTSGGSATPGGSNKQIQYNNSSTFGGASGFEYTTGGIAVTVSVFSPSGTGYTSGLWINSINGSTTRVGIGLSNPQFELEILGEISATNKSFVIDHPTKSGMKLRYGSLEGPENGVYVRGELKNSNIIEVPDHWLGLVHPDTYTVHLTPIGRYAQLYVEKIENYNVFISDATMNPIHCYYSVWAERKDIPKLITEYEAQ
jgi:hypothetical protein